MVSTPRQTPVPGRAAPHQDRGHGRQDAPQADDRGCGGQRPDGGHGLAQLDGGGSVNRRCALQAHDADGMNAAGENEIAKPIASVEARYFVAQGRALCERNYWIPAPSNRPSAGFAYQTPVSNRWRAAPPRNITHPRQQTIRCFHESVVVSLASRAVSPARRQFPIGGIGSGRRPAAILPS